MREAAEAVGAAHLLQGGELSVVVSLPAQHKLIQNIRKLAMGIGVGDEKVAGNRCYAYAANGAIVLGRL